MVFEPCINSEHNYLKKMSFHLSNFKEFKNSKQQQELAIFCLKYSSMILDYSSSICKKSSFHNLDIQKKSGFVRSIPY